VTNWRPRKREIEASSASIEETRNEKAQFEEKLDELRDTRSDLEQVRYEIESTDDSITSLKQERNDLAEELSDLPRRRWATTLTWTQRSTASGSKTDRRAGDTGPPERDPVQRGDAR